ncbi:MAG: phosphate signaling complex protein PhoU [Desulfovibrio sp.]|jgi:phosphate transport system protein|nr:phosphate signaling complex protein PhoU [Desulfovibrio sp.]
MTIQETYLHHLLEQLRTRLLVMCALTRNAVNNACTALREGNIPLAVAVIDNDSALDELENEIDAMALSLLARAQPVAGDLRFVVGALRMVIDLERIGDEAVSVAERTLLMRDVRDMLTAPQLTRLVEAAQKALHDALYAFQERDIPLALQVCRGSDDITQMEIRLIHDSLPAKQNPPPDEYSNKMYAMHLILIARSFSRICRRAENIAEHAYFIVEGTSLKHKKT